MTQTAWCSALYSHLSMVVSSEVPVARMYSVRTADGYDTQCALYISGLLVVISGMYCCVPVCVYFKAFHRTVFSYGVVRVGAIFTERHRTERFCLEVKPHRRNPTSKIAPHPASRTAQYRSKKSNIRNEPRNREKALGPLKSSSLLRCGAVLSFNRFFTETHRTRVISNRTAPHRTAPHRMYDCVNSKTAPQFCAMP